jgi:predicted transcriptional regulator
MVYNYVLSHPGEPFQRIRNVLDLNASTLRYHLEYLGKAGKVEVRKEGGQRCCYPRRRISSQDTFDENVTGKDRRVLDAIKNDPGITIRELIYCTNIDKKSLSRCIRSLRDRKLIWKVRSGRSTGYEYITKDKLKAEMLRILIDRFLNNEISKERFWALKEELERD